MGGNSWLIQEAVVFASLWIQDAKKNIASVPGIFHVSLTRRCTQKQTNQTKPNKQTNKQHSSNWWFLISLVVRSGFPIYPHVQTSTPNHQPGGQLTQGLPRRPNGAFVPCRGEAELRRAFGRKGQTGGPVVPHSKKAGDGATRGILRATPVQMLRWI